MAQKVTNYTPPWKSYQSTGNPSDIVLSTTVAEAIGAKIDAVNGQSSGQSIYEAAIDAETTIAAAYTGAISRSLSEKVGELADVRDWGVVDDPNGTNVDKNTEAFLAAIAATAGVDRLHVRAGLTITVNPLIIPTSNFNLVHDGLIILAPNSASNQSIKANLADFRGSNWRISGKGIFDGNRANQQWSVGQVVGGLTSNSWSTTDTWLIDPDGDAIPISDFSIDGVTIQNVGNWPVSFGYATRGILSRLSMLSSGNSPQFFAGATDCQVLDSTSRNITDAGFSLYAGTTRCSILNGTAYSCNQGFGSYCEDDTRKPNVDPLVANSTTIMCQDGSIGFTTGGTVSTLTQIRPVAYNNRSINDGASGANGISCWGAIGAQDVAYISNRMTGFGTSASSGNTVNVAYFDSTTNGLTFEANSFGSAGSSAALANGATIQGTKRAFIGDNKVSDTAGTLKYGIGGTVGASSVIAPNYEIGTIPNGYMMELQYADDTRVLGQELAGGSAQYSAGISVTGGQFSITAGTYSAAGTTQQTATLVTTQYTQITGGSGGVILPTSGTGSPFYINNSSGSTINVYPPSGNSLNGQAQNLPVTLASGTTLGMVQMSSNNWVIFSNT